MTVSIITPVYNSARFLKDTADSVINQTYPDWEWILVDDCSTDNSWDIMNQLSEDEARIRIFRNEKNLKSGLTRNFAIQQAKGRFIAFLDSDDLWHVDKLRIQVDFMVDNNYVFSHTSYGYLNENGERIKSTFEVSQSVNYNGLLKRTEISCLTAMYDAFTIGKFYMSAHAKKQDYALWLSILRAGHISHGLNKELAYYRQVKNSSTSKKHTLILRHITFLMETQGFNVFKAIYYTTFWLVNGVYRYFIK